MHSDWKIFVFVLAVIALVTLAAAGPLMSRVEQPTYVVEQAEGSIEIRSYTPSNVAEVAISGERKATIQQGFSIIAGYIFGANETSQKIEMTAPVMQEPSAALQTNSQTGATNWTVQFIMPAKWPLKALPKPKDRRIVLKSVPARTMVAIRFSGIARDALLRQKTEELSNFMAKRHLAATGPAVFAFFDPPWTLPCLRRNEVMIPINDIR